MRDIGQRTALVLGATGGIGNAIASRLSRAGWKIRALHRNVETGRQAGKDWEWRQGDALSPDDVKSAAAGVDLIVHAVNPPGYRNWGALVLPMIDNTIAAARAVDARILLPGTIYNFGPDAFPVLREDSPQNPTTVKGGIRVEMERRLARAAMDGTRVLIVRAGDFFGPGAANNWFSQGMVKKGTPARRVLYPGRTGTGHQWAYIPDVAETMIRLIERESDLGAFETFHMDGQWDADGTEMIGAIGRVMGSAPKVRSFPWWSVPLLAPFVPLLQELKEMRYLWSQPLRMDNSRLLGFLGHEPRTTLDLAVSQTLASMGSLPGLTEREGRSAIA